MERIIIIGAGRIGTRLYQRIVVRGWKVPVIITRKGVFKDIELTEKIAEQESYLDYLDADAVCLAIPTLDDGTIAFNYMKAVLEKDVPVVTCEKGALGNYFPELRQWLGMIGYNASVGGGSKLLELAKRVDAEVKEIYAIVNGTLNYCLDGMSRGRTIYEVSDEVKKLGYAEPGQATPLEIINEEANQDIPKKVAILFNTCFPGQSLRAKEIYPQTISEASLNKLISEASKRRHIVSITREDLEEDMIGGFKREEEGWIISGGFKNKDENPLFHRLVPSGVNNSLLICKGEHGRDGTPCLVGEGAGVNPTTAVMMEDLVELIGK